MIGALDLAPPGAEVRSKSWAEAGTTDYESASLDLPFDRLARKFDQLCSEWGYSQNGAMPLGATSNHAVQQ